MGYIWPNDYFDYFCPRFDALVHGFLDRGSPQQTTFAICAYAKGRALLDADTATLVEAEPGPESLMVLLGVYRGKQIYALDVTGRQDVEGQPTDLWLMPRTLPIEELALSAQGQHLMRWHAKNAFHAKTGSPTKPTDQGRKRVCTTSGEEVYPRIDPAVIMLVQSPDLQRVVLAHTHAMPPGLHSLLAGYVEPGETLEDTVRRETREEAGLPVHQITYVASQPWALSGSLMIGFTCVAQDETLAIDPEELESAAWYSRDDIARARQRPDFFISRENTIAVICWTPGWNPPKGSVRQIKEKSMADTHPDYHEINVVMTDGTEFKTRSTWGAEGETLRQMLIPNAPRLDRRRA